MDDRNREISTMLELLLSEHFDSVEEAEVYNTAGSEHLKQVTKDKYPYLLGRIKADGHLFGFRQLVFTLNDLAGLVKEIRARVHRMTSHTPEKEEFDAGMRRFAKNVGCPVPRRIWDFTYLWDPSSCKTVKAGVTPGGRVYEVVEGQFGRRTTILNACGNVYQTGPFVTSVVRRYRIENPHGTHDNTREFKGPRRRQRKRRGWHWVKVDGPEILGVQSFVRAVEPGFALTSIRPNECRFLRTFANEMNIHHGEPSNVEFDPDLSGTYDPGKMWARQRRLAKVIAEIRTGEPVPDPPLWTERQKRKRPDEYSLLRNAWALMVYDDSVRKGVEMAVRTLRFLGEVEIRILLDKFPSMLDEEK